MKYFAYGSNMCSSRLRDRVPSCKFYAVATIKGYKLKFHKRSEEDRSGKCNAFHTDDGNDEICGVVFEIDESEKLSLDRAEGLGHGYNEKNVIVMTKGGLIAAVMYVADSRAIDDSLAPYTWYKDFVVGGAKEHGLPKSYVQILESVSAQEDLDKNRESRNRRLLPCR